MSEYLRRCIIVFQYFRSVAADCATWSSSRFVYLIFCYEQITDVFVLLCLSFSTTCFLLFPVCIFDVKFSFSFVKPFQYRSPYQYQTRVMPRFAPYTGTPTATSCSASPDVDDLDIQKFKS